MGFALLTSIYLQSFSYALDTFFLSEKKAKSYNSVNVGGRVMVIVLYTPGN